MPIRASWSSRLPTFERLLADVALTAGSRIGTEVVDRARRRVRVDTSSLQRTIRLEGPERQGARARFAALAGDLSAQRLGYNYPVFYAAIVEYFIEPYMTPAAMDVDLERLVAEALRDVWGV